MTPEYHRILMLFVDGVGLAPASESNPLATAEAPALARLLNGPLCRGSEVAREDLVLVGLDATLGVEGLPQSATGQTTLFTGINAARRLGRHVSAFPGRRLREVIAEGNLLDRARRAGRRVAFANAYSQGYLDRLAAGSARRRSVTTCAVQHAGLEFRTMSDLADGHAVTWDIEGDLFAARSEEPTPVTTARTAGERLGTMAADHDLTVFETFLPDLAGHGRIELPAGEVVRRLDDLLGGVLACQDESTTVLLTSDHGNFETTRDRLHTLDPVPLLAVGPAAGRFADLESLTGVTPRILSLFGLRAGARGRVSG